MRKCKICGKEKDDWEFPSRVNKETGVEYFESKCRDCHITRYKERNADCLLESKYGINRAQWELILKSQDNKCKLCGRELDGKICTDHDHVTQIVRGLLCTNCNRALKYFDDPVLYEKFTDYSKHANALKELYKCPELLS